MSDDVLSDCPNSSGQSLTCACRSLCPWRILASCNRGSGFGAGLGTRASPSPVPDPRGARPPGVTRRVIFSCVGRPMGGHPRLGDDGQRGGRCPYGEPPTAPTLRSCSRASRPVVAAAGLNPADWTPRELRHFVSLLSDNGVSIEQIADLCGHSGTAVTESVYRHQLRPVLLSGAIAMDRIFDAEP